MHLLLAVINNEAVLDELITGWLDMGITEATVIETIDSVQLISHNIPIFAGLRSLTSGGKSYNKTIFALVETPEMLESAISYLKALFKETGSPDQGLYFVLPLAASGRLGIEER